MVTSSPAARSVRPLSRHGRRVAQLLFLWTVRRMISSSDILVCCGDDSRGDPVWLSFGWRRYIDRYIDLARTTATRSSTTMSSSCFPWVPCVDCHDQCRYDPLQGEPRCQEQHDVDFQRRKIHTASFSRARMYLQLVVEHPLLRFHRMELYQLWVNIATPFSKGRIFTVTPQSNNKLTDLPSMFIWQYVHFKSVLCMVQFFVATVDLTYFMSLAVSGFGWSAEFPEMVKFPTLLRILAVGSA